MKTNIRTTNIESDFRLTKYKGKTLNDTCRVYAPYVPGMFAKQLIENIEQGWTTFTFINYNSHEVAAWLHATFGPTDYNLKNNSYIKVYLKDTDQFTALRLAWG